MVHLGMRDSVIINQQLKEVNILLQYLKSSIID